MTIKYETVRHFSAEELPMVEAFLKSKNIRYDVRKLKSPTCKKLPYSVHFWASLEEQCEYNKFIIELKEES